MGQSFNPMSSLPAGRDRWLRRIPPAHSVARRKGTQLPLPDVMAVLCNEAAATKLTEPEKPLEQAERASDLDMHSLAPEAVPSAELDGLVSRVKVTAVAFPSLTSSHPGESEGTPGESERSPLQLSGARAALEVLLDSPIATPEGSQTGTKRKRKPPAKLLESKAADAELLRVPSSEEEVEAVVLALPASKQPKAKRLKAAGRKSSGRARGQGIEASGRQASSTTSQLQQQLDMLAANREPYNQNDWRKQPWSARPYEPIPEYQVAADAGEEVDKAALKAKLTINSSLGQKGEDGNPVVEERVQRAEILQQLANHQRSLNLQVLQAPLQLGKDVEERPAWGLDCYTHRALADAISTCKEMLEDVSVPLMEASNAFIANYLLPAINRRHQDGWQVNNLDILNICKALQELESSQPDSRQAAVAKHLLWVVQATEDHDQQKSADRAFGIASSAQAEDFVFWRVHPKGQGIFALRDIPGGTFVSEYLGELYSPWRWFEKQDLLRKRSRKGDLPDFYNICLERPPGVEGGADVIYVEAADRGNFASRLSHSCGPNCRNLAVVIGGSRITNALFATRDIAAGEELCWDYACVTESEAEFRAATCLCASPACRGSFLYYANSTTFQEAMQRRHNFLDRNALLVDACRQAVDSADLERLKSHGIGSSILGNDPPEWVIKWASLVLNYIEEERKLLPDLLTATGRYTTEATEFEAEGVKENRLQNLAVTLHKIAFFLRHQQPERRKVPPLQVLTEQQVLEHLFTGPQSAWERATKAALTHLKGSKQAARAALSPSEASAKIEELSEAGSPNDAQEAQARLRGLVAILRQCSSASTALADTLLLLANTETFFTPAKFEPVRSRVAEPESLTNGAATAEPTGEMEGRKCSTGKDGLGKAGGEESKVYRPPYLWGQCVAWFKQTVFDPTASLSADRRGTLSLPDIETAYRGGDAKGGYCGKPRDALLKLMTRLPSTKWPTSLPFSFKNSARVYGSVQLDAALRSAAAGGAPSENLAVLDAKYAAVLAELRAG